MFARLKPDFFSSLLGEAKLTVATPRRFTDLFGYPPKGRTGSLHLCAIVFGTANMERLEEQLVSRNIGHDRSGGRIVVPPGTGQGTVFAFEPVETSA